MISFLTFFLQMLNGLLPQKIRQVKEIPSTFPVTDDMVDDLLEGTSIEKELQVGIYSEWMWIPNLSGPYQEQNWEPPSSSQNMKSLEGQS